MLTLVDQVNYKSYQINKQVWNQVSHKGKWAVYLQQQFQSTFSEARDVCSLWVLAQTLVYGGLTYFSD